MFSRYLSDIVFPGLPLDAHLCLNASASSGNGWTRRALEMGFRYLEFRMSLDAGILHLENACVLGSDFSTDLKDIRDFSMTHPNDIILISLHLGNCPSTGNDLDGGRRPSPSFTACNDALQRMMTLTSRFLGDCCLVPRHLSGGGHSVREVLSAKRNVILLVVTGENLATNETLIAHHFRNNDVIITNVSGTDVTTLFEEAEVTLERHRSIERSALTFVRLSLTSERPLSGTLTSRTFVSDAGMLVVSFGFGCCAGWLLCRRKLRKRSSSGSFSLPWRSAPFVGHRFFPVFAGSLTAALTYCACALTTIQVQLSERQKGQQGFWLSNGCQRSGLSRFNEETTTCPELLSRIRRWLARPGRFRVNVLSIELWPGDACLTPCDVASLAALANAGLIRRAITLRHAGNPLSGSTGFRSLFSCPEVLMTYAVASRDEGRVVTWNKLSEGQEVSFEEDEYPMDSNVVVSIVTVWNRWVQLYADNIQRLIEAGSDLYVRGTESRAGTGFAYISYSAHARGRSCKGGIPPDVLNEVRWDESLLGGGSSPETIAPQSTVTVGRRRRL